ncbi:hypothetical protein, partial [Leucobacter chromiiresistens]|uniref:hypothetical protein n=1 Tax=Leucobacter chromiiresistens TaxID=1079994 RepID=UPI0019D3D277
MNTEDNTSFNTAANTADNTDRARLSILEKPLTECDTLYATGRSFTPGGEVMLGIVEIPKEQIVSLQSRAGKIPAFDREIGVVTADQNGRFTASFKTNFGEGYWDLYAVDTTNGRFDVDDFMVDACAATTDNTVENGADNTAVNTAVNGADNTVAN